MIIIAQIIFVLSVLGILFIIARKIPLILQYPRHSEEDISFLGELRRQWSGLKAKTGTDGFLHNVFFPKMEKTLRRIKIIVLKLDNFLAQKVDKLRTKIRKKKREEEETKKEDSADVAQR